MDLHSKPTSKQVIHYFRGCCQHGLLSLSGQQSWLWTLVEATVVLSCFIVFRTKWLLQAVDIKAARYAASWPISLKTFVICHRQSGNEEGHTTAQSSFRRWWPALGFRKKEKREREKKKNPADLYIGTYTQNHKGKVIQSPHKRRQPDSNIPKPYKPFYPYPKGWSLI